MGRIGTALLDFEQEFNPSKKKRLRDGLSAVVRIHDTLWLANDETISVERLSPRGERDDGARWYGDHEQFDLDRFLRLPAPRPVDPEEIEEADIEGLDYSGGYLWLVGSHGRKRKKPEAAAAVGENFERLAKVSADGNRFLLARIPVLAQGGTYMLAKEAGQGAARRYAAQLRGTDRGSKLTDAVARDEHLKAFLPIPGKDNGFDIEGLAVVGDHLLLGLRGPVLRGWAVILEVAPDEAKGDRSALKLRKFGPDRRPYRKHFLQLSGLGIRDLCVQGPDVLILAGPTMELDGPVTIFRWLGGAHPSRETVVFTAQLPIVLEVPYGQGKDRGRDHAEGMTLFGDGTHSVLIVYDAASKARQHGENGVTADIFELPPVEG